MFQQLSLVFIQNFHDGFISLCCWIKLLLHHEKIVGRGNKNCSKCVCGRENWNTTFLWVAWGNKIFRAKNCLKTVQLLICIVYTSGVMLYWCLCMLLRTIFVQFFKFSTYDVQKIPILITIVPTYILSENSLKSVISLGSLLMNISVKIIIFII